jgi:hypothetical protein
MREEWRGLAGAGGVEFLSEGLQLWASHAADAV